METIKSYTNLEQSKKLAEILPVESADMYYFLDPTPVGNIYHLTPIIVDFGVKCLPKYDEGDIPAWSLSALLELMPNYQLQTREKGVGIFFGCKEELKEMDADTPIDAAYNMVVWLLENGHIKTERK